MKKKIFIITGMILCILAGIVIVPSVIRTRQAVKEFEKDISEGKNVKLENYIKTEKVDYSNPVSDTGYNTGLLIEKFMNKGIKKTVKILSSLFLD